MFHSTVYLSHTLKLKSLEMHLLTVLSLIKNISVIFMPSCTLLIDLNGDLIKVVAGAIQENNSLFHIDERQEGVAPSSSAYSRSFMAMKGNVRR